MVVDIKKGKVLINTTYKARYFDCLEKRYGVFYVSSSDGRNTVKNETNAIVSNGNRFKLLGIRKIGINAQSTSFWI